MKIAIVFFSVLFFFSNAYNQSDEALKERIVDAEYFFINEDYGKALELFKDLYKDDPTNANFAYRIGMCYQQLPFEAGRSIKYLKHASENTTREYNEGSYKEKKAPIVSLYYLANAYHTNNYLNEALETYNKYKDSLAVDDIYNIKKVERQIVSVENAREISKLPVSVEVFNLGNVINSAYADYNPVLSANGDALIYTRTIREIPDSNKSGKIEASDVYQKILVTYLENDGWSKPIDVTEDLETKGKCKTLSLSADGKTLFLYRDDWKDGRLIDFKEGTIYYSKKVGDTWTPIKKLNRNINTGAWESHASISPDGKQLYFTSDRKGGMGGLDIYVSDWEDGDWGPAHNLGPAINTPFDEETPFMLEDGKTLYFSSQGHFNMGGFDVFYTHLLGNGEWSEPVNAGYPINSTTDNLFYHAIKDGSKAYYALARHEGYLTFGNMDIYELDVLVPKDETPEFTIKGKIMLEDMNQLDSSFKIYVFDTLTEEILNKSTPDFMTNEYKITVPNGDYKLVFEANNYKTNTKFLSLPKVHTRSEININAHMIPKSINSKQYYVIKNIYFDFNSSKLTREALIETEKLYTLMKENPDLYIEVIGHTDSKGSDKYNKKLSLERSRAVINYLVGKGIEKTRFVATGKGEEESIAINTNNDGTDNTDGMKLNRRVEMKILQTNNESIVTLEEYVPDELRFAEFNSFYIAFFETAKPKTKEELAKLEKEFGEIFTIETENGFISYFGGYSSKADASRVLNDAISKGYNNCRIMDYFQINKANKFVLQKNVNWPIVYTIQLKAVDNIMLLDAFINLEGVKQKKTADGFYRYTYNEYIDLEKAKEDLHKVIEAGYVDAFIIEKNKLKN